MTYSEYKYLVFSDLYRFTSQTGCKALFRQVTGGETFKYVFWLRTCRFLADHRSLRIVFMPFAKRMFLHYRYKLGIDVPYQTNIGPGFYIGHFGGIVVNEGVTIGRNCNLMNGVTLGKTNRGKRAGLPTIGDNVYIGPGAKVIGKVSVGHRAAIGANCVVTHDVPDHAVVVGIPARVISLEGSAGYVNQTDYDPLTHTGKMRLQP